MAAERDARARLRAAATSTPATIPTTAQSAGADPDAGPGTGEDAPSASTIDRDRDRDRSRLVQIYRDRGLSGDLPEQVADQLLAHDPLHARFEAEHGVAEPPSGTHATLQSLDAAIAFIIGSLLPLLISAFLPRRIDAWATVLVVVASLTVTSVVAARHNGTPVWRTVLRSVAVGVASLTVSSIAGSVLQP